MSSVTACDTEWVCDMAWSVADILSSRKAEFSCPVARVRKGARTEAQVNSGNIGAMAMVAMLFSVKVFGVLSRNKAARSRFK